MEEFSNILKLQGSIFVCASNVKGRHWTLYGQKFRTWHLEFGHIYDDLNKALDIVAELLVQLGEVPLFSIPQFIEHSFIAGQPTVENWYVMIENTNTELWQLIEHINEICAYDTLDEITKTALTDVGKSLRIHAMFTQQTLK